MAKNYMKQSLECIQKQLKSSKSVKSAKNHSKISQIQIRKLFLQQTFNVLQWVDNSSKSNPFHYYEKSIHQSLLYH